jgi:hypothetical protein
LAKESSAKAVISTKISDKYVVQRFMKEFEKVLALVYTPTVVLKSKEENKEDEPKSEVGSIKDALKAPLNYLRFKEFLIEMCFMTEQQATSDTVENSLAFELWELIAPKVNREFPDMSLEDEALEKLDSAYITEM